MSIKLSDHFGYKKLIKFTLPTESPLHMETANASMESPTPIKKISSAVIPCSSKVKIKRLIRICG